MTIHELRERATKATKGPWRVGYASGRCTMDHKHAMKVCDYRVTGYEDETPSWHHVTQVKPIGSPTKDCQMIAGQYDYDSGGIIERADSEYIAALPPEVVLAMLDVVDASAKADCSCGEEGIPHGREETDDQVACIVGVALKALDTAMAATE